MAGKEEVLRQMKVDTESVYWRPEAEHENIVTFTELPTKQTLLSKISGPQEVWVFPVEVDGVPKKLPVSSKRFLRQLMELIAKDELVGYTYRIIPTGEGFQRVYVVEKV